MLTESIQTSETTNNCDRFGFRTNAPIYKPGILLSHLRTGDATINMNEDVYQTNNIQNAKV